MVFHEVDSDIVDLISGHRVIMYYIEGDTTSKLSLRNSVESVMEMLKKKNDDLIIFKVCQNTHQFSQFKELYKPMISAPIALFVINSEGIPLICEQINEEDTIFQAFDSICTYCKLNSIPRNEFTKVNSHEAEKPLVNETSTGTVRNGLMHRPSHETSTMSSFCERDMSALDSGSSPGLSNNNEDIVQSRPTSTVLQIRLPDGTKEKQRFDEQAFLQEVYDFIHSKFNLNDFDLKTYNRNVFSSEDYERTLQNLDLTPNGVVIVVYKNVVPFRSNNSISRIIQCSFWIVFAKVSSTFQYIHSLLHNLWTSFFSSGNRSSGRIEGETRGSRSGDKKSASNGFKTSVPRFGNIHTLRRNDDSDDENNRYNGNSTQQK